MKRNAFSTIPLDKRRSVYQSSWHVALLELESLALFGRTESAHCATERQERVPDRGDVFIIGCIPYGKELSRAASG